MPASVYVCLELSDIPSSLRRIAFSTAHVLLCVEHAIWKKILSNHVIVIVFARSTFHSSFPISSLLVVH